MTRTERLALALAAALCGSLMAIGAASAHVGEDHASGAVGGLGAFGLLAAVLAVGVIAWLTNRGGPRSADRDHPDRIDSPATPGMAVPLVAEAAARRAGKPNTDTRLATRLSTERRGG